MDIRLNTLYGFEKLGIIKNKLGNAKSRKNHMSIVQIIVLLSFTYEKLVLQLNISTSDIGCQAPTHYPV